MIKKVIPLLLSLVLLALVTAGCRQNVSLNVNSEPQTSEQETAAEPESSDAVTVDGEPFNLTYETSHKDMNYKTDIVNLSPNTAGALCDLTYYKDGEVLFVIHLVYYEAGTVEEMIGDSGNTLTDKPINGIDYKYFEYDENGMAGHTYAYAYNGTAYSISFASNADISQLEEAFMNNVSFG